MAEKIIFLAYENPKLKQEQFIMACESCRNKTFVIKVSAREWPELYCAACGLMIGAMGWAHDD